MQSENLSMQSENNVHDVLDNTVENNVDIMLLLLLKGQLATEECLLMTLMYPISVTTVSTKYPIHYFLNYNSLFDSFKHTIMLISFVEEPQNFEEVVMHPSRVQTMKEELKALEDNKTWSITELLIGKTSIGCRWVYKVKHKVDDSIEHYKVCLVAKGYTKMKDLIFWILLFL